MNASSFLISDFLLSPLILFKGVHVFILNYRQTFFHPKTEPSYLNEGNPIRLALVPVLIHIHIQYYQKKSFLIVNSKSKYMQTSLMALLRRFNIVLIITYIHQYQGNIVNFNLAYWYVSNPATGGCPPRSEHQRKHQHLLLLAFRVKRRALSGMCTESWESQLVSFWSCCFIYIQPVTDINLI